MTVRQISLCATLLVVGALAVWFSLANWDVANRVASVVSALAGVTAVGVAIWAALRGVNSSRRTLRVARTGRATTTSGVANSGAVSEATDADIRVSRTGDADATDGGSANTGFSSPI